MTEYILRDWTPADIPALKQLWITCFEDSEELVDDFFARFLHPGCCVAAELGGIIVSAMYILPIRNVSAGRRKNYSAGYTYALATLPAYRNRGIGTAVYLACCRKVHETAALACVLPAERSLYPFYRSASGAQPVSFVREARFTREGLKAIPPARAVRFPGERYGALRENLLTGYPHATFDEEYYEWMEQYGIEFFLLEHGLAAAEVSGGQCRIRELLVPEGDPLAAAAAVARWCPAEEYILHTPVFFDGPGEETPYMLASFDPEVPITIPDDLWWGFGFE